jgi:hypothetical protein
MTSWFEGLAGPEFATAVVWTFAALILLVIVLVIIRLIRSLTFGTFVAGGRNRKTRLAVMDATAVDSHRRLVLVRRDDIEHLLLIGGPTDVVVEREIRFGQSRRNQSVFGTETAFEASQPPPLPPLPAPPAPTPPRQRAPEPVQLPPLPSVARNGAPPQPARQAAPQPMRQPIQPAPRTSRQTGARPPVRETPLRETPARETPMRETSPGRPNNPARAPAAPYPPSLAATAMSTTLPAQQPARSNNLDDALLRELEVTFDAGPPKAQSKPVEMTLDDEMTKLLGELSNHKR